jgi:hypothetical protein
VKRLTGLGVALVVAVLYAMVLTRGGFVSWVESW